MVNYIKYNFETRGIGILAKETIQTETYIGDYLGRNEKSEPDSKHIYNGWVETSTLGKYLNHNSNANCKLVRDGELIKVYSNKDIKEMEELTINYLTIIELLGLPEELVKRYNLIDFDYVVEKITL